MFYPAEKPLINILFKKKDFFKEFLIQEKSYFKIILLNIIIIVKYLYNSCKISNRKLKI